MKHIIKRFWIVICLALLINIPILVFGMTRTDQSVLLKGDTTNVNSIVEIGTDYEEKGSFSSIYVISFDHSTMLQNFFVKHSTTSVLEPVNENYKHFSDLENYQMGQVQKNSSIMTAIITAYTAAKELESGINIDYTFQSYCVSFYFAGSAFRIGDEIIKINDKTVSLGADAFEQELKNSNTGDVVTVLRNNAELEITLTDNAYRLCRWYPYYNIDYDTISPSVKINKTSVGGPSGGLLQTLSIFNRLVSEDYTHGLKIAGTGTMSLDGTVGAIGGIQQKIFTAFDDSVDVFFCPEVHYEEALAAYNTIKYKEKMTLVSVRTLADAIAYLQNV